jgi:precorrin-2 dehydrogenase/sirohydrochlorin ferrochelatase
MEVYPVFLTGLATRRCIVIGGGPEAERKVRGLLDGAAAVTVIGAEVTERLQAWAEAGVIARIPRDYEPGDLQGAFLVIATGYDPQTNRQIWREAEAIGALLNVADDAAHSSFIAGAVLRQGPLTLAISTSGCAPAFAVRLRERFERQFGPEYAAFLELMRELRHPLAARYPDFQERRARWYALIDSDLLELLRDGKTALARQRAQAIIDCPPASAQGS